MGRIELLMILVFGTSCVHNLTMGHNQQCSNQNMILSGIDLNNGSSVTNEYGGRALKTYDTESYSESVHCIKPKTPEDFCRIKVYNQSIVPEAEFNKHNTLRNFTLGIGYCAFILPGVAGYYYFDYQRNKSAQESQEIIRTEIKGCEKEPVTPSS